MTWHQTWMPQFLCLWTFYPFLDLKLFWQPSCTHLYTRMTSLIAEISRLSSKPCTLPEVTSQWQLIVVSNCLRDCLPGSRKIEQINREDKSAKLFAQALSSLSHDFIFLVIARTVTFCTETLNLIYFPKYLTIPCFSFLCLVEWPYNSKWQHFLSLCHLLLDGTKIRAHKMKVAQPPSTTFLISITLLFSPEILGQHCQKEGSVHLYCIESVENDADELKINFWASWNNNVNWAAQKDFIQTFQLPIVQGDAEGSFFSFHQHFHRSWELLCPNTRKCQNTRKLCTINVTGFFTI